MKKELISYQTKHQPTKFKWISYILGKETEHIGNGKTKKESIIDLTYKQKKYKYASSYRLDCHNLPY